MKAEESSSAQVLNADYTPLGIIGWQRAWSVKYEQKSRMSIDIIDFCIKMTGWHQNESVKNIPSQLS